MSYDKLFTFNLIQLQFLIGNTEGSIVKLLIVICGYIEIQDR